MNRQEAMQYIRQEWRDRRKREQAMVDELSSHILSYELAGAIPDHARQALLSQMDRLPRGISDRAKERLRKRVEAIPFDAPQSGAGNGQGEPSAKSKRGPRNYSKAEKVKAVKEWNDLDKDTNPIRLEEWLDAKFGNENGVLNVKQSTFYGWRKLAIKPVDTP